MPHQLNKLTPNLVVSDVERSAAFYRDHLGFAVETTVPDAAPYVFVILRSGPVQIFLNAPEPAIEEYPAMKGRPLGGTFTMFIEVTGHRRGLRRAEDADSDRGTARNEVVRRRGVRRG